jgi:hypothetical protein
MIWQSTEQETREKIEKRMGDLLERKRARIEKERE